MRHLKPYLIAFTFFCLGPSISAESNDVAKRSLTHEDYDSWKTISSPAISNDGNWVLYLETPQDGEAVLVVQSVVAEKSYRHPIGYSGEGTNAHRSADAAFTSNTTHVVFLISPSQEAVKKAKKSKNKDEAPKKSLGIMDLSDGSVTTVEQVKSFKLAKEAGGWLAYLKEKPKADKKAGAEKVEEKPEQEAKPAAGQEPAKAKDKKKKKTEGTPLVVRSLADGSEQTFPFVTDYLFTDDGRRLLYIVSSKETPEKDGLYSHAPGREGSDNVLTGEGQYTHLTINKDQNRLAFLTDRDDQASETPSFHLYGWDLGSNRAELWVSEQTRDFPAGMVLSDKSRPRLSDDGKVVLFGIQARPEEESDQEEKADGEESEGEEEEEAKFDLWHWNDPYPQPQQKRMAQRVRDNAVEAVYYPDKGRFVQLGDDSLPDVSLSDDGKQAYAVNQWPYTKMVSYDGTYADLYAIDPENGKRQLAARKIPGFAQLSPGGRYLYWYQDTDWFTFDIRRARATNITKNIDTGFDREDWDTPNAPRGYGSAGWTEDDESILLYDRFDIWVVAPDGSEARMMTEGYGRRNQISFRYRRLDPDQESIPSHNELLLSATNEDTMATGFFTDRVEGDNEPRRLTMADADFSNPVKAKNADRLLLSRQTFKEYPDLWVSDLDLTGLEKMTSLGEQTDSFLWGEAELRSFYSSDGVPLKGILIKPENFDPDKKYPLMVYIYETLHTNLHRFRNPGPGTSINPSYYVSNGYVLWMPDIEYHTGYPGRDALKCVLPGIQMLTNEGYIDPDAVGIQGHSWGGYQIAYMVTQTNVFKAAESGAPVSNMVSAYGGIRWGSGMVRQFQYERTQSRLGASLWEVPLRYIENSPIFWVDKIQTPLLILHNDDDGAVPWYQGIEFMMALRRLSKEAYMFNYNGEAHGLRKRINQKDYTVRMAEFFDHHLRGAPAPEWMTEGIQAWDKKPDKPQ